MSLQRRLLLYLAICAPLVWGVALFFSVRGARLEVNELFDAELIRLARQVQATLPVLPRAAAVPAAPKRHAPGRGEGDLRDLAIAVWDGGGRLVVNDREGVGLPFRPSASGFVEEAVGGEPWRIYYLQSADGSVLVAAGQKAYERDELVFSLIASQSIPWLVLLPVLLAAMAGSVRLALGPVHLLSGNLRRRRAEDLAPIAPAGVPAELVPLVEALNGLFSRVGELLARERRFTADAAHELRTPLAVLRAQWDVVRRAGPGERAEAESRFQAALERMDRLVAQLLALARAEAADATLLPEEVRWPPIVEQVATDCLPLLQRRGVELACDWPRDSRPALPLRGDPHLLTVLLRNLVDNAARYAPAGSTVALRMGMDGIEVENEGEPLPPQVLASLGERFRRSPGQQETGSGLGVSIAQRVARLHGLELAYEAGAGGRGVKAVLRLPAPSATSP
ncbi:ATP-binding protein [Ramlibacter sp.]|uniref:ATP-binding protein n=1 Tax=Ramlibacter sp. TaxID=1917967 RepID=UPI002FCAC66D